MSLSYLINHILNKTSCFIKNVKEDNYSDREELQYKFSRLLWHFGNLIAIDFLGIVEPQRVSLKLAYKELEFVKNTLAGDLSSYSWQTAIKVLKKFRAQMKGLYAIVSAEAYRDENGNLDESYYEQFEAYIDPETGEITEAKNTEVSGACVPFIFKEDLRSPDAIFQNCITEMQALSLTHKKIFRTSIDGVDVFLSSEAAAIKRDKRIQKTTTRFFSLSDQDTVKLPPKIEKSVACRKKVVAENKNNNLENFTSREVILTMLSAIKQLKLDDTAPKTSEEYLNFSDKSAIRLAHMPSPSNLSNVFINHLGRYGRLKKDEKYDPIAVLSIFETIQDRVGKDKLINIMLQFGTNPSLVTPEFCELDDFVKKDQTLFRGLIRALTLVFQAEIWRYQPINLNQNKISDDAVRNISFAMGLAEGLELLEEDKVELEDLFDADAAIGLPTGQKILNSFDQIRDKQKNLQGLVQQSLIESYSGFSDFTAVFPEAEFVPSKCLYTGKLVRTFGHK